MLATILVVEDDTMVAESIRDVLVAADYVVPEMASSGASAIEAAARLRPSLVLMDVQLDGPLDGIEAARQIREAHGIRVIYLTGFTDDTTLRRAKETAPLGYLRKPFNGRELRIAVEIALHQASLEGVLAAREQLFATTLQSIGDAVLTTDAEGRVTFLNRAAQTITARGERECLGRKLDQVVRLVDARGAPHALASVVESVSPIPVTLPHDVRLQRGSESVEIEGSVAPIEVHDGRRTGSVLVFRDVAERRRLEKRLGMTDRLAAIGTMAAGMQHEINNPLASVVANVQFALDFLTSSPQGAYATQLAELVTALQEASEGAERVRRTVEDLRHFSRVASVDAPIDLTVAIDDAVRMTAHAVRHHATVRLDYGRAPRVRAEEGQLARVFTNLLLHAAHSVGDGKAEHHTVVVTTRTDGAGRAVVEIADDGAGFAPEALHRIFDPFFTTAIERSATGLGLAVCHTIVTSLGGEIDVESTVGKGTTFRVSLPAADAPSKALPAQTSTTPPGPNGRQFSGRARILVLDDEIAIGKAIRRILGSEHDIALESDARTALARLAHESYDVVFCDLMMPNMSGMEFFAQVTARIPELAERIVFLTGGAFSPLSEEFLRTSKNMCLAKPFSRESVGSAVRKVLRRSHPEEAAP